MIQAGSLPAATADKLGECIQTINKNQRILAAYLNWENQHSAIEQLKQMAAKCRIRLDEKEATASDEKQMEILIADANECTSQMVDYTGNTLLKHEIDMYKHQLEIHNVAIDGVKLECADNLRKLATGCLGSKNIYNLPTTQLSGVLHECREERQAKFQNVSIYQIYISSSSVR